LCGVAHIIFVGWLPYLRVKSRGTNTERNRCLSVLKFSQISFQLDHVSFIYFDADIFIILRGTLPLQMLYKIITRHSQ